MDGNADNPFPWFSSNDPVPGVDPADLRSMWMMQRGIQASVSGQVATDVRLFERACSPGADVQAIWYRLSMLQMLPGPLGVLSPWLRDSELADAVFKVAATFPMKRMSVGVPQQELPFDVKGFLAEIEREENNH